MGSLGGRIPRLLVAACVAGSAPLAGCGDDDRSSGTGDPAEDVAADAGGGDGAAGTGPGAGSASSLAGDGAALQPCSEDRHLVVFDINGTLGDVVGWFNDPDAAIEPHPGAVELATAYHDRGYELMYVAGIGGDIEIEGLTVTERLDRWFAEHAFPPGQSLYSVTPDAGTPLAGVTEALLDLSLADVALDAGYTNRADKAQAFVSGGVPRDRLYTWDPDLIAAGHVPLAEQDFREHLAEVEAMPPVCRPD